MRIALLIIIALFLLVGWWIVIKEITKDKSNPFQEWDDLDDEL